MQMHFIAPAASKRIIVPRGPCGGGTNSGHANDSGRRRVIFPCRPKTGPHDVPPPAKTGTNNWVGGTTTTSATAVAVAPPADLSTLHCPGDTHASLSSHKVSEPAFPFLASTSLTKLRLLPRESTLSSQEDDSEQRTTTTSKKTVSFELHEPSSSAPPSATDSPAVGDDAENTEEQGTALLSILRNSPRRGLKVTGSVETMPSVESDVPSLESSSESDSCEEMRRLFPVSGTTANNAKSTDSGRTTKRAPREVSFDPRVWVREFERTLVERENTWYTTEELEQFKLAAFERIIAYSEQPIATGTGRVVTVSKRSSLTTGRAMFSHQALGVDNEVRKEALFRAVLQNEMRRILVVDSHDICLNLFSKTLQPLLPHAEIVLVSSAPAALAEAGKGRFDLVIAEEHLTPSQQHVERNSATGAKDKLPTDLQSCSGTALIEQLKEKHARALYVAVSSRFRGDLPRLQEVGDVCWPKPPPHMNACLLHDLLRRLLIKRRRFQAVAELYAAAC